MLFRRSQDQVGEHIVEQAAAHARQIGMAIEEHGMERVESVLDAALALEQHIDIDQGLRRARYPELMAQPRRSHRTTNSRGASPRSAPTRRVRSRPGLRSARRCRRIRSATCCGSSRSTRPSWSRGSATSSSPCAKSRSISIPVFACQIMNEGWASYWHARLLREADFLPQSAYVDAIKCHSDVVRPTASGENVALSTNPYHLGFSIWEKIVEEQGLDAARKIMCEDDDFAFVRNHLTLELATELKLFRFKGPATGTLTVQEMDLPLLHEALLAPKYGFGAPTRERLARARRRQAGAGARPHDRRPRARSGARTQGARIHRARVAPAGHDRDGG